MMRTCPLFGMVAFGATGSMGPASANGLCETGLSPAPGGSSTVCLLHEDTITYACEQHAPGFGASYRAYAAIETPLRADVCQFPASCVRAHAVRATCETTTGTCIPARPSSTMRAATRPTSRGSGVKSEDPGGGRPQAS